MWSNFFQAGGWGMYPTSISGFLLAASAVLYLMRPDRRFVPVVASLAAVAFGAGLLSTCVGIVNSLHYLPQVPQPDQVKIAGLGISESLNNLVLALIILVPSGLVFAAGSLRATRMTPEPASK